MTTISMWRLVTLFAVFTAIGSSLLSNVFPQSSFTDISGYGSPVIAFEMAKTEADLLAIFGPQNDTEHASRITQMDWGNLADFLFIFCYAGFLGMFSLAAHKHSGNSLFLFASAAGFLAGLFDGVENLILLKLTDDFNSQILLSTLWVPVYSKFTAIALSTGAGAYLLVKQSNITWKLLGLMAIIAALVVLATLFSPSSLGWMLAPAIGSAWLCLLSFSIKEALGKQ